MFLAGSEALEQKPEALAGPQQRVPAQLALCFPAAQLA